MLLFTSLLVTISIRYVQAQATSNFLAKRFMKKSPTTFGPERLAPGWQESSQIRCAFSCTMRYPQACHSFMYNEITHLCTPGSGVSTSQLSPSSSEGELYVTDDCDSYPEFSVHSYNMTRTFAAYFPVYVNYTQAASTCRSLDSHLYVPKTQEKYAIFLSMALDCAWMGLDDIEVEGQFVWADDLQPIDQLTMQMLHFQPDNYEGRQNCARGCGDWFDDDYCEMEYTFICEKSNSAC